MAYNDKVGLLASLLRQGLDADTGLTLFGDLREQRQTRMQNKKEGLQSLVASALESAKLGTPLSGVVGQNEALATALGLGPRMQKKSNQSISSIYGLEQGDSVDPSAVSDLYIPEPGEDVAGQWGPEDVKFITQTVRQAAKGLGGGMDPENFPVIRQMVHDQARSIYGDLYESNKEAIDTAINFAHATTTQRDASEYGMATPTSGGDGGEGLSGLIGTGVQMGVGGTALNYGTKLAPGSNKTAIQRLSPKLKGAGGALSKLLGRGATAAPAAEVAGTGASTWTNPYSSSPSGVVRNPAGKIVGREAVKAGSKALNTGAAAASEGGFLSPGALSRGANPAKLLTGGKALAGGLGVGLAALAAEKTWNMAADATDTAESGEWDNVAADEGLLESWAAAVEDGRMDPDTFRRLAEGLMKVEEPDMWNRMGLGLLSSQNRYDDNQVEILRNRYSALAGALGLR